MPEQEPTRRISRPFPPLETVTRPNITTEQAAYYLNRRPQTMRIWACRENGPVRPIRINGRLAWPVADIRRIAEVGAFIEVQRLAGNAP